MSKKLINRKSLRRIKLSSLTNVGYKIYNIDKGLFYNGKNDDYNMQGKVYVNLGDCRKALSFQDNLIDDRLIIIQFNYELKDFNVV